MCLELSKPQICNSSFILCSSSHASWFCHLDPSLSFCHLFLPHLPPLLSMSSSFLPRLQQHPYRVFVLLCYFSSAHAFHLPPIIYDQNHLAKGLPSRQNPHPFLCLFSQRVHSLTTYPKQYFIKDILTPTYIEELARVFQYSASWLILLLCLGIISCPLLPLGFSLNSLSSKKCLCSLNS